jgi:Clr5 domain
MQAPAPSLLIPFPYARSQFGTEEYIEPPIFQDYPSWELNNLPYRSRETSVVVASSTQEWDTIKPVFTDLYSTQKKPLKEVMEILKRDRAFVATYASSTNRCSLSFLTSLP